MPCLTPSIPPPPLQTPPSTSPLPPSQNCCDAHQISPLLLLFCSSYPSSHVHITSAAPCICHTRHTSCSSCIVLQGSLGHVTILHLQSSLRIVSLLGALQGRPLHPLLLDAFCGAQETILMSPPFTCDPPPVASHTLTLSYTHKRTHAHARSALASLYAMHFFFSLSNLPLPNSASVPAPPITPSSVAFLPRSPSPAATLHPAYRTSGRLRHQVT